MFYEKDELEIFADKLNKTIKEKVELCLDYEKSVLSLISGNKSFNEMKKGQHCFVSSGENILKLADLERLKAGLKYRLESAPRYEDVVMFSVPAEILKRVDKKIKNVNKRSKTLRQN